MNPPEGRPPLANPNAGVEETPRLTTASIYDGRH